MAVDRRVCSYSAGTVRSFKSLVSIRMNTSNSHLLFSGLQETNPIFLFNKEMILSDRDPTIPKTTFSIESEIQVKVEESLLMPAVFHTVASRTQLALVVICSTPFLTMWSEGLPNLLVTVSLLKQIKQSFTRSKEEKICLKSLCFSKLKQVHIHQFVVFQILGF